MKAYVVGGAVRDELLGQPVSDRDWVVVGATPGEMTAAGYRPVGKDFPVFLHPQTHEEYALARTERKSGRGYRGFTVYAAPEVTLEQDLERRDLTINAMARDADGRLVDPFGGERDLREGVLRHVSEAFVDDPVRVLRVARFAARLRFRIADETMALMRRLADSGELDHLVAERVWQEVSRGLGEDHPVAMFDALRDCGALRHALPELAPLYEDALRRDWIGQALGRCVAAQAGIAARMAMFAWALREDETDPLAALCARIRVPREIEALCALLRASAARLLEAASAAPADLLELLKRTDAFRRPGRLAALLEAWRLASPGAASVDGIGRLERAHAVAAAVDSGAIAERAGSRTQIPDAIDAARLAAISAALND